MNRYMCVYCLYQFKMYINYLEFCKIVEIVNEWKHQWGCTTAHSKADALMAGKIKVLQPNLWKLWNYTICVTTIEH
jgi:hypothetical protein